MRLKLDPLRVRRYNHNNNVVVIAGPTGIGKSNVAQLLCKSMNGEIILGDSVQICKYFDIGSNKPSKEEMLEVPHHLVDFREPSDRFTAGDYVRTVDPIISGIISRGKLPVIVGGNTMWLDWLLHGIPISSAPSQDNTTRAQTILQQSFQSKDWDEGIAIVRKYHQEYTNEDFPQLQRNDWYRLRRHLEMLLQFKSTLPIIPNNTNDDDATTHLNSIIRNGLRYESVVGKYNVKCFFMAQDRTVLYDTLGKRCENMIMNGLVEEVTDLILSKKIPLGNVLDSSSSAFDNHEDRNVASLAIGYRQTVQYLCRKGFLKEDIRAFADYFDSFSAASRNYAKRQFHWFRKDSKFLWINIDKYENVANISNQVFEEIKEWLNKKSHDEYLRKVQRQFEISNANRNEVSQFKGAKKDYITNYDDEDILIRSCEGAFNQRQLKEYRFKSNLLQTININPIVLEDVDACTLQVRRFMRDNDIDVD